MGEIARAIAHNVISRLTPPSGMKVTEPYDHQSASWLDPSQNPNDCVSFSISYGTQYLIVKVTPFAIESAYRDYKEGSSCTEMSYGKDLLHQNDEPCDTPHATKVFDINMLDPNGIEPAIQKLLYYLYRTIPKLAPWNQINVDTRSSRPSSKKRVHRHV